MKSRGRTCYCYTCDKALHPMGVARHRAAHIDRKQDCKIQFTSGAAYLYKYSRRKVKK